MNSLINLETAMYNKMTTKILFILLLSLSTIYSHAQGTFTKYNIGDFIIENGDTINDCTIGCRTFGKPNKDNSNTLVLLTWFAGKSIEYTGATKPGNWADSTKFYVVVLDALGNGVSSSPSNSSIQDKLKFPEFSIRDMVNSHHKLLTQFLNIDHVYAIAGYSMGGFQTFQWIVSHPKYMDKAIVISGTPRLDEYDKLFYQAEINVLELGIGTPSKQFEAFKIGVQIFVINLFTPAYIQQQYQKNHSEEFIKFWENYFLQNNFFDWTYQMKALRNHDIYTTFNEPSNDIISRVKANTLIIVNPQDRIVSPAPSIEIARQINVKLIELNVDCGHFYYNCENKEISVKITEFLNLQ